MKNMKNLLLGLFFTATSILTLPAYAWPEVDHMNMCGSATKVVQSYGGNWKGWNQHDKYIAARGNAYYLRSNCPTIVAPVKTVKTKKKYRKPAVTTRRIAKSTKAKSFKRTVKYDEKADCARVDRMNGYGSAVSQIVQRTAKRNVAVTRVAKRRYNYFKK